MFNIVNSVDVNFILKFRKPKLHPKKLPQAEKVEVLGL